MNPLFVVILAASLPTFRDFSRIDRERRTTGQFQTTESLQAMQKSTRSIPLVCPKCQGAMRVINSIEDPSVIRDILNHRSSGS
jgi:hypothetical protein